MRKYLDIRTKKMYLVLNAVTLIALNPRASFLCLPRTPGAVPASGSACAAPAEKSFGYKFRRNEP